MPSAASAGGKFDGVVCTIRSERSPQRSAPNAAVNRTALVSASTSTEMTRRVGMRAEEVTPAKSDTDRSEGNWCLSDEHGWTAMATQTFFRAHVDNRDNLVAAPPPLYA